MRRSNTSKLSGSWIVTIIVCLLIVGSATVVAYLLHHSGSEEYRHYAKMEGIKAYYFKDFQINDTLSINATLLEAEDSSTWQLLLSDFEILEIPPRILQKVQTGEDVVLTKYIINSDTTLSVQTDNKFEAVVAVSLLTHTLTVFHITTDDERLAIMRYNYSSTIKN